MGSNANLAQIITWLLYSAVLCYFKCESYDMTLQLQPSDFAYTTLSSRLTLGLIRLQPMGATSQGSALRVIGADIYNAPVGIIDSLLFDKNIDKGGRGVTILLSDISCMLSI